MRDLSFVRRAVLAGTLALSLTGVTAGIETAQALPAAPLAATTTALTTVQYYGYGYRRYPRRYYGYRYRGRAGLYRCGPYAQHTHLQRQACR